MLLDGGKDRGAALVELAQAFQLCCDPAQRLFVQRAGRFFAIASDKRDGIAIFEQGDGSGNLRLAEIEGNGDFTCVIHREQSM